MEKHREMQMESLDIHSMSVCMESAQAPTVLNEQISCRKCDYMHGEDLNAYGI